MCDITHQITKSSVRSRNYPNFRVSGSREAYILQGRARAHEFGTQRTWANLHQGNTHCSRTGGVYLSSELFITFIWFYFFFFHGATLSSIYSFATVRKANESCRLLFLLWRMALRRVAFLVDVLSLMHWYAEKANGWEQEMCWGKEAQAWVGWEGCRGVSFPDGSRDGLRRLRAFTPDGTWPCGPGETQTKKTRLKEKKMEVG